MTSADTLPRRLDVSTLREWLSGDAPAQVLDVRTAAEFEVGHVPGSVNIPLLELPDREAVRVQFFDEEIETLAFFDPLTGELLADRDEVDIYPAKHFVTPEERVNAAEDWARNYKALSPLDGLNEVFEAVADPEQLSSYFTTGGASGRLVVADTACVGRSPISEAKSPVGTSVEARMSPRLSLTMNITPSTMLV